MVVTMFSFAIQYTPFEVVYGQPPPMYIPYLGSEENSMIMDRSL